MLPFTCFAQVSIIGTVSNQKDGKPVADASVFLSNATIGTISGKAGDFILRNVKPGKYELVVSLLGFETYNQAVTVGSNDVKLPDILLLPKAIVLKEVTVNYKNDPNREKYYSMFKDQFLGASRWANECKILNPEILDFDYDEARSRLNASSGDFLLIENDALGYKIKFLLKDFTFQESKIYYEGFVFFEELKGSPGQEKRWQNNRQEVYENSPMQFLRAALKDRLTEAGFRVQQYSVYANPGRPADSVINARIAHYHRLKDQGHGDPDSLAFWTKKSELPKTLYKLEPGALSEKDIVRPTEKPGQYALGRGNNWLYVAHSKNHRYHINDQIQYLYNSNNNENTLVEFNEPEAIFNTDGVVLNPHSILYFGVWGKRRVAEMLPVNYEPPAGSIVPGPGIVSANVDSLLKKYQGTHPTEKAYLQFDKPYYAAGDTMYFKAYVVNGETHLLSDLDGVLHVDFIGISGNILQSEKLRLDSGRTSGDFALPDLLSAGSYRVRAYTQWMLNNGQKDFFEKVIPIGSVNKAPTSGKSVRQQASGTLKPDIQFFPEGGSLGAGIRSKVAFKAIGSDGLGIGVSGVIVDNKGENIASFSSAHLGMGNFYFTPDEGKSYSARIKYANGFNDTLSLPKAANGIALVVQNEATDEITVSIAASKPYFKDHKGKYYKLQIYSHGESNTIICKLDNPVINLDVPKKDLKTGVAVITLFSLANEPLCERLVFAQHPDQLKLDISSDKKSYASREKAVIRLNDYDAQSHPAKGYFSVSVVNQNLVNENENTSGNILSYLLLSSDLSGHVEQPNYYFADTSLTTRNNLDLLMLTQGYRRFTWKQVFDTTATPAKFPAEKGIALSGQLQTSAGKPIPNGTIYLFSVKGGLISSKTSDDKGMFAFPNLYFVDTVQFVLSAVDAKGNKVAKIIYTDDHKNSPPVNINRLRDEQKINDTTMSGFIANERQQLKISANRKAIQLKQVVIKGVKKDDQYNTQSLAGAGHADQVLHTKDLGYGPLLSALNGVLRGVIIANGNAYLSLSIMDAAGKKNPAKKMLIIVDGVELNSEKEETSLGGLQTTDVETVEVLKYASASIYGMQGAGGVLIITTKQRQTLDVKDIASSGILPITAAGFYKAREFYSPRYGISSNASKQSDLRSTIYWNPDIRTDAAGNASFEYFNSDGTGVYKIIVEGIDENGNVLRSVYRYEVR